MEKLLKRLGILSSEEKLINYEEAWHRDIGRSRCPKCGKPVQDLVL